MQSTESTIKSSVEMTLRHFAENGSFNFMMYYAGTGVLKSKIDRTWEVGSVTVNDEELSFTACQKDQRPVKFSIRTPKPLEKIKQWFIDTAKTLQPKKGRMLEISVPQKIVFTAEVTEYIK